MIEKLKDELNTIQQRQTAQQRNIDKVYLELNEMFAQKQNLQTRLLPTRDLFAHVRPEVMYQILEFVDLKTFLKFRLVNKKCNQIIKTVAPQKSLQLEEEVKILENDLEKMIQDQQLENETELNQQVEHSRQALQSLTKASINEMKSLANPPQAVKQVCQLIYILINPQADEKQFSWNEAQKMINHMQFLNTLLTLDISSITEKQLASLAAIDNLTVEQVRKCSKAASELFVYACATCEIRKSKLYINKYRIDKLKKSISTKKAQVIHLKK